MSEKQKSNSFYIDKSSPRNYFILTNLFLNLNMIPGPVTRNHIYRDKITKTFIWSNEMQQEQQRKNNHRHFLY